MERYSLLLLVFSCIIFVSYVVLIWKRFGILPSISDSYYAFPGGAKTLFASFITCIAIPVIIVGNTPLMFFAGFFLAFVGCAPAFKLGEEKTVHKIGAIGGISMGLASMWVDFNLYYIPIIVIAFTIFAIPKRIKSDFLNGISNHVW
jgi:hypothetical protein